MVKFRQMTIDKKSLMENLKLKKNEIEGKCLKTFDEIVEVSKNLDTVCEEIKESWTGSCIGYHSKLYYGNFEKPPRDESFSIEWGGINGFSKRWIERTPTEVKGEIESRMGKDFKMDDFEKKIKKIGTEIEDFQKSIEVLIPPLIEGVKSHPLSSVDKYEYNRKLKDYIKHNTNRQWMSRDTEAFSQGIIVPSIIYYQGVKFEAENLVELSKKYFKAVELFIDWCEINGNNYKNSPFVKEKLNLSRLHPEISSKCQNLCDANQFAEAVEKGFKTVRDKLRELTSFEKGSEAFGKGKLHIKGAAASNVDSDFNEGAKFLTMAIDMFRNEKSHTSNAKIEDAQKAYEYLSLSSLAMNLLDEAEIKP